jgi:hypothetical protein
VFTEGYGLVGTSETSPKAWNGTEEVDLTDDEVFIRGAIGDLEGGEREGTSTKALRRDERVLTEGPSSGTGGGIRAAVLDSDLRLKGLARDWRRPGDLDRVGETGAAPFFDGSAGVDLDEPGALGGTKLHDRWRPTHH